MKIDSLAGLATPTVPKKKKKMPATPPIAVPSLKSGKTTGQKPVPDLSPIRQMRTRS